MRDNRGRERIRQNQDRKRKAEGAEIGRDCQENCGQYGRDRKQSLRA
jgi:hypothetical protein